MYDPSIETSATDFGTAQVLPSSAVKRLPCKTQLVAVADYRKLLPRSLD